MEPVGSSVVSVTSKVVLAIVKAVKTARRNKARCREIGQRAKEVDGVLRQYKINASAAAATRRILGRLKDALDDALKLVESCGSGGGDGMLSRLQRIVGSGGVAAKLDEVNGRINNCLADLQVAIGASLEMKMDRQAANNARIEKKIDQQLLQLAVAAGGRDHHRTKNSGEINAGKNGSNNKGGWINGAGKNGRHNRGGWNKGGGQQNGGKGGKRRRGKKAAGPPPPPSQPQFCPHGGAGGVPFYPVYHSMEEDPTSCSVM